MRHPFDLELSDLEAIESNSVAQLTDEEAASIGGGQTSNTLTAVGPGESGESGGIPLPELPRFPELPGNDGPSSGAIGEEGGDYVDITALLGEAGTPGPRF